MAAVRFKVAIPQSGQFAPPVLTLGQMRELGEVMVTTQKQRWSRGINAEGKPAAPLHPVTAKGKATYRHISRPLRDMQMTGLTVENFTLRKVTQTELRAENTSREARRHARQAQRFEPMIGIAPQDEKIIFAHAYRAYGLYLQRAWKPTRG